MICPGCDKNNIHPGYSYRCDECIVECECGCALPKYIIEDTKKAIDVDGNIAIKRFLNYNKDNIKALKMIEAYVKGHCPQYIDIVNKFMVLL